MVRARDLAVRLHSDFTTPGVGIFGRTEMPEDAPPQGVGRGTQEHLLFITLTVTIDYQRDAPQLWELSREVYQNPATRYLYEPAKLFERGLSQAKHDMNLTGLSRKAQKDPYLWYTVATTFLKKYGGYPRRFLEDCQYHAPTILERLQNDTHELQSLRVPDFPYLRGPKIGRLWVRMLRDNIGIEMTGLDEVPIPVDVHVLRATLCTGVISGYYEGPVGPIFEEVRSIWKNTVRPLKKQDGQPMISLDLDEPLWHLSKYGCSSRQGNSCKGCLEACPAYNGCAQGKILVKGSHCTFDT
jgi:hypothetical protein